MNNRLTENLKGDVLGIQKNVLANSVILKCNWHGVAVFKNGRKSVIPIKQIQKENESPPYSNFNI